MVAFRFDKDKALAALLYVAQRLKEQHREAGIHKIAKILYFADERHLAMYGRPIMGDTYIAMENGPVPSKTYDIIKMVRGDGLCGDTEGFGTHFRVSGRYNIIPKHAPDLEQFSETDLECLDQSIVENKDLSFEELVKKSHARTAYQKADRNDQISLLRMAADANADEQMLHYIEEHARISTALR